MKKILSLGTAAAVLSLTAVAASAALAPVVSDTAVAGEQVVVEVVANDFKGDIVDVTIKTSENLTLAEYTTTTTGMPVFNEAEMHFGWISTAAPAEGEVLLTLVFDVNAAAGEEIEVSLVPAEGYAEGVDADVVTRVVVDGEETDITDVTTTETVTDTESDPVETVTETESETVTETETETQPTVPDTGIALAVVPALVAGAAVVVAKKRK